VPYWEQYVYTDNSLPTGLFLNLRQTVQSCIFTMDVAKRRDGEWMVVELRDAQLAGLPETASAHEFYKRLSSIFD
jgi:hypothetical protein